MAVRSGEEGRERGESALVFLLFLEFNEENERWQVISLEMTIATSEKFFFFRSSPLALAASPAHAEDFLRLLFATSPVSPQRTTFAKKKTKKMGAWKVFVECTLPPPILLLTLLVLPSPAKAFTRLVLRFVDRTLALPVIGTFQLLHVMIALSGAAAVGSVRDAAAAAKHKGSGLELSLSASAAASYSAKRWRAERNAWIAAFSLAAWCLLARVYSLARRLADLEDEREARLAAAPATAFRAAAVAAAAGAKNNSGSGKAAAKGGFEASAAPSAPPLTRANSNNSGGGGAVGSKKKQ